MVYKEKYRIGIEDVAHNSQATNKALLSIMEDIACAHSADVGYGVPEVETKHRAWVLLDWKIKVIKRPAYGCIIDASTWSRKIDRLCAYRDFELKDEGGEILAIGSSRWILTDTERRRPVRLTEDIAALYESEDKAVFEDEISEPKYSKEMFENAEEMIYNIQRRDIDINMHMHNINYLDVACEMLPEDVYNNENFNQVRIWYKREIRPQDEVKCRYLYEDNIHYIIMTVEGKIHSVIALS